MKRGVPNSLRVWFLIHFAVDMFFAIPLIIFPDAVLNFLNLSGQTVLARLVGAALFAIGGASLFSYKQNRESYNTMLTLKLFWAGAAITGLLCSAFAGETIKIWYAIGLFLIFFLVWTYYKAKLVYEK
jgi:hypothetical protein